MEGIVQGFDAFLNLVIEGGIEVVKREDQVFFGSNIVHFLKKVRSGAKVWSLLSRWSLSSEQIVVHVSGCPSWNEPRLGCRKRYNMIVFHLKFPIKVSM